MAPEDNRVRLAMDAREENVAIARAVAAHVASALNFTLPEVEELRIAVSEAVANAVLHAYDDPLSDRGVEVALEVSDGALRVEVCDYGRGIADVTQARKAEFTTLDGHLGLGFAFMEAMTDSLEVLSEPGAGTTVRMVKRPHGGAEAPPDGPSA